MTANACEINNKKGETSRLNISNANIIDGNMSSSSSETPTGTNSNVENTVLADDIVPHNFLPPNSPASSSSTSKNTGDSTFEPTIDMMVNDFDDEGTLEEEEALAAQESQDASAELSSLQKESDMSIEELLALYNCAPPSGSLNHQRGGRTGARLSKTKKLKKKRTLTSVHEPNPTCPMSAEILDKDKGIEGKLSMKSFSDDENNKKCSEGPKEDQLDKFANDYELEDGEYENDDEIREEEEEDEEEEEEEEVVDDDDDHDEEGCIEEDDDEESKEVSHLRKLYPETYHNTGDKRFLRTISQQPSDEEEDGDYSPDEDDIKKTIMVGSNFQAVIPEGFLKYDDALPYENEDKLLWDPSRLSEKQTEEYLLKAHQTKQQQMQQHPKNNPLAYEAFSAYEMTSGNHLRDDEQALYLLLQCGHNTEEALRRKRINAVPSTEHMSIWSEEECRHFESGIRVYGKDFYTIKQTKISEERTTK